MAQLTLHLFGRPEIRLDNTPLTRLNSKAEALVYYVAATRQAASRELLAGLLWSDFTEERARGNLRVELGKIRPVLAEHLHIQRQSVALATASNHVIDLHRFEDHLNRPNPTAVQIEEAAALYKEGGFLADFAVKGAPLFEEWQRVQQERLRQTILGALQRLSAGYGQQKQYEAAITAARRVLEIEPWSEMGHQALMRWFALSGQKLSALAQYDQCRDMLAAELAEEPSDETEQIYNQILTGQLEADPEAGTMQIEVIPSFPAPFQPLPPSRTFVGRELEITRLRDCVTQSGGPHIVALVGMGGIGKTTIANQISHALRGDFTDGVLWANAATTEPLDILQSWGQAYGFDFSGINDLKNRAAAVRGVLADKKVLVVLDDVVQVARIRPLLPNGARCAVVLTTRDLDVATALNAELLRVDELLLEDGRELLQEILGEARVAAELEAAETICHQLQLHPLALEITAMRLKSRQRRTLASMADRLRTVEQRLGLELKDRAVRASFEVSWGALTQELREVFARLAVFGKRSFTSPAVAYVLDEDEFDTEDHLFALSALSLIREEGDVRFQLHALLADFAEEKIGAEKGESNGRMATYFHTFAEEFASDYDQLGLEWGNLLSGIEAAHDEAFWSLVLRYIHTLKQPWFNQNRINDLQQAVKWGLTAAQETGDRAEEAFIKMIYGQACIMCNDNKEAHTYLQESLSIFRSLGDEERIGEILFNLARIAYEQSRFDESLTLIKQSYQTSQRLDDAVGSAKALYRHARVLAAMGKHHLPMAKSLAEQAGKLFVAERESHWTINIFRLLAEIAIEEEDIPTAERFCQEAFELSKTTGSDSELITLYIQFVALYRLQEKFEESAQYARDGIGKTNQMGYVRLEGLLHYELGFTLKQWGKPAEAILSFERGLPLFVAIEDKLSLIYTYILLGDCHKSAFDLAKARNAWQLADELIEETKTDDLKGLTERRFAEIES